MTLKVGIIGYGYWGPNIARNFDSVSKIGAICDTDYNARRLAAERYPGAEIVADSDRITGSKDIDIVAVVTPLSTHYELAKKALENGKHVFVEKPFTSTSSQAEELISLAEKNHLQIMIDHTFLFTDAVSKIKSLIEVLGNIYYYDSMRVNLGLFQHDVNVIWDLAPHDFYTMSYLIKEKPLALSATGFDNLNRGLENVAYLTVYFNSMIAHFNLNWLSPVKIRQILIGGQNRMLVWNDLQSDEKIKIYDRGVDVISKDQVHKLLVSYRSDSMWSPRVDNTEALRTEIEYFLNCINTGKTPFNDGRAGLKVVKFLEAADESLSHSGKMVKL